LLCSYGVRSKSPMKKLSLWQRFNFPLAAFVGLLLIAVGLAWWVQAQRSASRHRNDLLEKDAMDVRWKLAQLSDFLRAALLDPKNATNQPANTDAQKDLEHILTDIQDRYVDQPNTDDLMNSLRRIRRFGAERLESYRTNLINLQATDSAAAIAQYAQSYAPVLQERDQALNNFDTQIDATEKAETKAVDKKSLWGLAGLVVVVFFALIGGLYQTSSVTQPLGQLVESLERMRRGDFTKRIDMQRRDEFGVLADGLNRLADDLSVLVGQVQRSGIQVNSTATEISATARQQQSTANEIAATTAQIGATSKQISATSRELLKTMSEVNDVAEETGHLAGSGLSAITSMETTMRQIMDASGSINSKLAVLNEKTSNINSVVTTITKVADQTNLLSLNAAIEAEKAGEYGLGFAVVAMEIRRLADQTAVATYDIEKTVKEMQSAVSAGVMGMDKFSDELRQGVEEIRQISTQLAQIIHQVQALAPRFQTVNEGMQSQTTGAQQISDTLTQLSDAAHQTAESLRQSNHAIEQLNNAARSLQNSVTRFKLEEL
jgi:methyl-accepting chemotaxis protein WspA